MPLPHNEAQVADRKRARLCFLDVVDNTPDNDLALSGSDLSLAASWWKTNLEDMTRFKEAVIALSASLSAEKPVIRLQCEHCHTDHIDIGWYA